MTQLKLVWLYHHNQINLNQQYNLFVMKALIMTEIQILVFRVIHQNLWLYNVMMVGY